MRSRTSGMATTSTTAMLSCAMTSGGVPVGANSAFQPMTSKRGRPLLDRQAARAGCDRESEPRLLRQRSVQISWAASWQSQFAEFIGTHLPPSAPQLGRDCESNHAAADYGDGPTPLHLAHEPEQMRQAARCGAKTRSGTPCRSPAVTTAAQSGFFILSQSGKRPDRGAAHTRFILSRAFDRSRYTPRPAGISRGGLLSTQHVVSFGSFQGDVGIGWCTVVAIPLAIAVLRLASCSDSATTQHRSLWVDAAQLWSSANSTGSKQ
jgi:hypothetical protein